MAEREPEIGVMSCSARSTAIVIILPLLFQFHTLQAQDCPCCDQGYHQFDFWIGDWIVYDSLHQEVGHNMISSTQAGCLLVENWTSSGGGTGTSFNYYNPNDSTWNQLWVDSQGGILELKGGLTAGNMVLKSDLQNEDENSPFYHQIRWEPDGSQVIQTWETLDQDLRVVSLLFKGYYTKKSR